MPAGPHPESQTGGWAAEATTSRRPQGPIRCRGFEPNPLLAEKGEGMGDGMAPPEGDNKRGEPRRRRPKWNDSIQGGPTGDLTRERSEREGQGKAPAGATGGWGEYRMRQEAKWVSRIDCTPWRTNARVVGGEAESKPDRRCIQGWGEPTREETASASPPRQATRTSRI